MSCEDCLSRREFLARGTLGVVGAAALAAGCGDGQIGPTGVENLSGRISVKVSTLPGLATVGQLVRIPPDSAFIVARRNGPASFSAFTMECTHEGSITNLVGNQLQCPSHNALYDSNGAVLRQPNAAGRATSLPTYGTTYDPATDILTIG